MQRSRIDILVHFVWATRRREPWLTSEIERLVYRCIETEVGNAGCRVLALGGMPDHVHLLVEMAGTVTPARLMMQVKGVSSTVARQHAEVFPGWQDNYAAMSVSRRDRDRVEAYIRGQKEHHASGSVWAGAEMTTQDASASTRGPGP